MAASIVLDTPMSFNFHSFATWHVIKFFGIATLKLELIFYTFKHRPELKGEPSPSEIVII